MTAVARAVLHRHTTGWTYRLVIKGGNTQCLVVKTLLGWIIHMIEG